MSIVFGGPGYKWRGNNIRSIDNAVTLPRSDSFVSVSAGVSPDSHYELIIVGRNKGGNGKVEISCTGCDTQVLYIKSQNFVEHKVRLHTENLKDDLKSELRISRTKDCYGNILIKSISYTQVPAPIIRIEPKESDISRERDLLKQKAIRELQADKGDEERASKTGNILASRGQIVADKPIIIGGSGYRWRGRAIRVIQKQNFALVNMMRKDSVIMAAATIASDSKYKVTITAGNNNGNGALLVNFFGGKNYDGQPISVNILNSEIQEYTVTVPAPKFPSNLPIYLRVWRPNDATGSVIIKTIQCVRIGDTIPRAAKLFPKLKSPTPTPTKPKRMPALGQALPKITENTTMKFKPYEMRKSTAVVQKVLVSKPEDVPRVSIITPTRDGLELLKKCYAALDKNTDYPNWEWIVGDSASTDGTEEWFKTLDDTRIKFVQRGTTEGSFSSINNELTGHATGEYYLFLNNDTQPQPFWLYEMVAKIHHNPKIGIVGAKLLYSEQRIQHAGIAFIPQGPANLGKAVLSSFPTGFADRDRFYQAVTGACLLIRAQDFKAVGGFDPIYYFCYEDVDLCLKVGKTLNKKILYAANAVLLHAESITQKKHKTTGEKQQIGIRAFKERWMGEVNIDFSKLQKDNNYGVYPVDVSFVTCVNNLTQYRNYIIGSLFKNNTTKNYELIPVLNFGNPYSAAQALNIGISKARSNIVVLCHQDVIFYEDWVEMLFSRIKEVEQLSPKWGVLGTAGITKRDDTVGVVHSIKGSIQWQSNRRAKVYEVQTVDEHCMIIRRNSGLKFDEKTFNGFHFYGPDLCLNALNSGLRNFGILCPLVHDSSSGSLASGKSEFMRLLYALAKKWRGKFDFIRTPTSIIRKKSIRTFVRFNS